MISTIRYANVPICKLCKNILLDTVTPTDFSLAKCVKFGAKCRVSGEITYLYADRCRRDANMCGDEGKQYESKFSLSNTKINAELQYLKRTENS